MYTVGEEKGPVRADAVLPELPLLLSVPARQNIQQSRPEGHTRKTVQSKSRVQTDNVPDCVHLLLIYI